MWRLVKVMKMMLLLLLLLLEMRWLLLMSVLETVEIGLHPDAFGDSSVVGNDRQRLPHLFNVDASFPGAHHPVETVAR